MNDKFLSFLGITKKSGNLFLGMDPVKDNIIKKNISLILITKDISERSLSKISRIALENGISIIHIDYTMEDIYSSVKRRAGIIGVSNENFVSKINDLVSKFENDQEETLYDDKVQST